MVAARRAIRSRIDVRFSQSQLRWTGPCADEIMHVRSVTTALALMLIGGSILGTIACSKQSDAVVPAPVEQDSSHACVVQVEGLRRWLSHVASEGDVPAEVVPIPGSDRYADRTLPDVPLVALEEAPVPLPVVAIVSLHHGVARFGDTSGPSSDRKALDTVMTKMNESHLSPGFGFDSTYVQPLVLFVGAEERWSDLSALIDAAARHGITEAYFAFAVKSTATPPRSTTEAKRIVDISIDQTLMPWQREVKAARELEIANPSCPRIAQPFANEAHDSRASDAQRTEFMNVAADVVLGCACHVDVESVKALAWTRYGRQWGPATANFELQIAVRKPDGANALRASLEELGAPASSTWTEISARVVDASRRKARVFVTSK